MEQRAPTGPPSPTLADYFAAEHASPVRHEFRDGRILAMAGASEHHLLITGNAYAELRTRLKGTPCRAYVNELRVFSSRRQSGYCYPDVTIVCGPSEHDAASAAAGLPTIVNPRLIVEVLSPSTAADDRGDKFDGYRDIPTFEQYVLVAHDRPYVQTFTRQAGGGWLMFPYFGLDAVVPLSSLGVELPLAEVYAGVALTPAPTA